MFNWLRRAVPQRLSPAMPGGPVVRLDPSTYDFPVVYLANDGREPGAPAWLAFTAVISAKQGAQPAPQDVQPYTPATVLDGAGGTRELAWESLRRRLTEVRDALETPPTTLCGAGERWPMVQYRYQAWLAARRAERAQGAGGT